jgi:hypothetical protein
VARGGKRPGAGRKPGSKDRATIEQRATLEELAREHTDVALQVLVQVAQASESDAARVSAANAILDRGYGKPKQSTEITGKDGGPIETVDRSDRDIAKDIAFVLAKGAKAQQSVN